MGKAKTVSPFAPKTLPRMAPISGVRFATAEAGIRYKGRTDLMLAVMDPGTVAAGVLTQSKTRSAPVEWSLALLESLHQRWVLLLRGLSEEQWSRAFRHPDHGRVGLERTLALYAWHGRHHLAHITSLREREGWA